MRPKGKLFALLAIFAAIGLVTATGAFTSVQATRTAEVNVAGDAAALLSLQPEAGPNGYNFDDSGTPQNSEGYAQLTGGTTLEINLVGNFDDAGDPLGSGVNHNATTDIQAVFNITNQGTQDVNISITDSGSNSDLVTFYSVSDGGSANTAGGLESDEGGSDATLTTGSTMVVSIWIDTENQNLTQNEELINSVTINATTTS